MKYEEDIWQKIDSEAGIIYEVRVGTSDTDFTIWRIGGDEAKAMSGEFKKDWDTKEELLRVVKFDYCPLKFSVDYHSCPAEYMSIKDVISFIESTYNVYPVTHITE